MKTPTVRLCAECKYAHKTHPESTYTFCRNPVIAQIDADILSGYGEGAACRYERAKTWFGKCGMKGKLWEPKE